MITLTSYKNAFYPLIESLYLSAFPKEERRPTKEWRALIEKETTKLFVVLQEGDFCGFITYWDLDTFTYVEHFAITPEQRGKGIGTHAFTLFLQRLTNKPVLLEVEPEYQGEIARKRIEFYNKHSFNTIDMPYIQPPYKLGGESLPLTIMTTHPKVVAQNYDAVINELISHVYLNNRNKD